MSFIKKTWLNRDVPYPDRRTIYHENGSIETVDIKRAEGTPEEVGTQLNAETFNDLEDRIYDAVAEVDTSISTLSNSINTISSTVQNKQDVLTAGTGISIENNVISISLIDADTQEY